MTLKELNKSKVPIVTINPKLEKYKNKVLFQDKLDDANKFLEKAGIPHSIVSKNNSHSRKITLSSAKKKNGHVRVKHRTLNKKIGNSVGKS
jgi:hypothetical protein